MRLLRGREPAARVPTALGSQSAHAQWGDCHHTGSEACHEPCVSVPTPDSCTGALFLRGRANTYANCHANADVHAYANCQHNTNQLTDTNQHFDAD